MGVKALAFAWGLAEATVFFIVPDVLLTFLARERLRDGLTAALYALAGALLGGWSMYRIGETWAAEARQWLDAVPAISSGMIARVAESLHTQGLTAVLLGPLSGTPYKLYALEAPGAGIGLVDFLAISVPARLGRFVLVMLLAHYALRGLCRLWRGLPDRALLGTAWIAFYVAYFSLMPG